MTISVHKRRARCSRCGLQLRFGWWTSKSKQLRDFTMMHETLITLRKWKVKDETTLNACGILITRKASDWWK